MHFAIPLPDRWRQMDPRVFMASWMKDFVSEKQSKQCPGEQYPILMSGFYIWAPAQTSTQIYMHTAHAHTHMERQDEIRRTWIIKIRSSKSPSSNSHITYHISHIIPKSRIAPYFSEHYLGQETTEQVPLRTHKHVKTGQSSVQRK